MDDSSDDDVSILSPDDLSDKEDELYPSGDSEEDDDDGEDLDEEDDDDDEEDHVLGRAGKHDRFKIETQKDQMASDIEDDDEDGYLPNAQAWGKDKREFYHTDFVDKDFRNIKEKDKELAKFEEQEALAVQKRLLQSVNEADLGLDLFIPPPKERKQQQQVTSLESLAKQENIDLDISSMSEKEKLAIIKQDSPELESLIADFKQYSQEISDQLNPIIEKLTQLQAPSSSGLEVLKLRRSLLLNYCTNISFYLSLKSSKQKDIIKAHPVIKQLFIHKKFITELDAAMERSNLSSEMEHILSNGDQNIQFKQTIKSSTKKPSVKVADKKVELEDLSADSDEEKEDEQEEGEEETKRAITYEMEKNKGLIPKRKREQRNPRVKYRRKFEKATIRRKGQVREPRKEIKKYGGELTGINARAVKSVKFR